MFVVFAQDLPFLFPARDGLPATLRETAVFRTEQEANEFLKEQEFITEARQALSQQ
jgi:hypothetical protein